MTAQSVKTDNQRFGPLKSSPVCLLWSRSIIWHRIYESEFGRQTWKQAFGVEASAKDPVEVEDRPALHWKKKYFRTTAGQEIHKWRRELGDVSPSSGLSKQTERILRYRRLTDAVRLS